MSLAQPHSSSLPAVRIRAITTVPLIGESPKGRTIYFPME